MTLMHVLYLTAILLLAPVVVTGLHSYALNAGSIVGLVAGTVVDGSRFERDLSPAINLFVMFAAPAVICAIAVAVYLIFEHDKQEVDIRLPHR